jgi:predicted HicB family RNase H-like nuclease
MQDVGGASEQRSISRVETARRAKEQKTAVLNVRIRPSIKAIVERLADADGRSLANYVERLIENADDVAARGKKS